MHNWYFYSYNTADGEPAHTDYIGNPDGANKVPVPHLGQVVCVQATLKDSTNPTTNNGKVIEDLILYFADGSYVAACNGTNVPTTNLVRIKLIWRDFYISKSDLVNVS